MNNIKKQPKKIIAIIIIIILGICYFIYSKDDHLAIEENTSKEEENITEQTKETKKQTIIVHVSGAVNKEGIVELEEDSRIADAIEKAGGLKANAETKQINLAYKLEDGMKIYIPTKEEIINSSNEENKENNQYAYEQYKGDIQQEKKNRKKEENGRNKKININKASQEELDELPGVGASTASEIIRHRKENGEFKNIEDIKEVSGIGEAKYNKIKEFITVK